MTIWWRITAFLFASSAFAADPFYLGRWKIDSASRALVDRRREAGRGRKQGAGREDGYHHVNSDCRAGILACKGPHYKVVTIPAEGLFQGSFEEMGRTTKLWIRRNSPPRSASWANPGSRCRPAARARSTSIS